MSLLELVTGVTPASTASFTVQVTNAIESDSTSSYYPNKTSPGLAFPAEGPTIAPDYSRRASSLLWALILSTSISSVDPVQEKGIGINEPFPGTPHSLHHLSSDVSNASISLKGSDNSTLIPGISNETSDVFDPGNATELSLDYEQDGGENARQVENIPATSGSLGSLSEVQPDGGKLMKVFSPTTAGQLSKAPSVTGDAATHLLDLNIESLRTTSAKPETSTGAVLVTMTDSSQINLSQISSDSSEEVTVSIEVEHATEFTSTHSISDFISTNTNNLDGVTTESKSIHTEASEHKTEDTENSMPKSTDDDSKTVKPLLSGLSTLDYDEGIKAVTRAILSPSTQQWELVEPKPSYVDAMITEPINAGLPEPQKSTRTSPESQNEEPSIPESQDSGELEVMTQNASEYFAGNLSNETPNVSEPNDLQPIPDAGIDWTVSRILLFIIQLIIMVETVLGNLMVILAVRAEKKLQTPFNYYIVNLAFTDMNVGLSVMSLFMIYNLYDYFPFGSFLCDYWIWSDYTMTFESVMTLAAISLDRLWSVTWSLHYRNHNSGRKSVAIILATWCLVTVIWLPPFIYDRVTNTYGTGDCYWDTNLNKNLVAYVGFSGYYSPLLVMLVAYARILWVVRKRAASIRDAGRKQSLKDQTVQPTESSESGTGMGESSRGTAPLQGPPKDDNRRQEAKLRREMKAVYTLLNIVIIFLICWVPFYTLFVLSAWFPKLFPNWFITFSYWMAYINSALNPILYPLSSPEFRAAYKKVLRSIVCKK